MNGKNPLVMKASEIHLPMPYEDEYEDYDYEDDYDDDYEEQELPDAMSEDEAVNGAFPAPPSPDRPPKRRRRMPPMPRAPRPKHDPNAWVPPFEVTEDGTVIGPTLGDADPTRLPEGFDPAPGTFEGVTSIFRPPGSAGGENLPRQQ